MKMQAVILVVLCLAGSVIAQDATASTAVQVTERSSPSTSLDSSPQKVHVAVFYETYCKDSTWFITKQLLPVYKQLKDRMAVELVPYGRTKTKEAKSGGPVTFVCRHGASECTANILHSCALALYPDTELSLNFIACTLGTWKPERAVRKCTRGVQMESQKLLGCLNSEQGKALFRKMGERTAEVKPPITSVPSVVIAGNFNKRHQRKIQRELKAAVCGHIKPPLPAACGKPKKKGWFGRK